MLRLLYSLIIFSYSFIILNYRDLGRFIREKVKAVFESGDLTQFDSKECAQQFAALTRLADNKHRNKYKRLYQSTSTGLSTEECKVILSSEMLEYLKEEDKGFFRKIFNKD